ncbi:SAICAR synthase-like protein [Rhizoclosmatium globosum]|uniref:SAICAR synthase-like protein n=1 Tax=Rhizoclosmatium globosum TaxID=329046 RepID=A0A1Y2CJ52_9FUNG|nr:SAICAR synthase-like protein [Rhizoclosmatium globosum]|eukprot:ORY46335.1 SAICAR synthase-like protein [Rhizoclosmatium globosum]
MFSIRLKSNAFFDFKGIPDRRSGGNDTSNEKGESRVLWDGDWIDGGFKLSTLLSPPSKRVLMEALESDTKFLTQANTMDYSLLIGIGKDSNQIRVGIIDFIGPYTMLKMVETKGKTALRGNATVIPPENYAQRFCAGIDQYFYDVPSYWTIALDV